MGVKKFHASAVHGADPRAVERELLMSFDRIKHGAQLRVYPKPSIFGRIADHLRIASYNLFRARQARTEIDATLAKADQHLATVAPQLLQQCVQLRSKLKTALSDTPADLLRPERESSIRRALAEADEVIKKASA